MPVSSNATSATMTNLNLSNTLTTRANTTKFTPLPTITAGEVLNIDDENLNFTSPIPENKFLNYNNSSGSGMESDFNLAAENQQISESNSKASITLDETNVDAVNQLAL